ncbi:hypothetical protein [Piscirickettsia salmonis]|uniref:hypothetical protein n=1 Tax=Piscirickettsia salmonis TaxID=1238 RepID=UPI00064C9A05|nr:hypothetical protein [Piscirickettsia salmonis]KLV34869.1 hypothetical protein AB894_11725 [Piscirickettsia salmonis]
MPLSTFNEVQYQYSLLFKEACLDINKSFISRGSIKNKGDNVGFEKRKRRYLGRYFAHPMMQNRRAKRDDYKPSAVRVTQRYVP